MNEQQASAPLAIVWATCTVGLSEHKKLSWEVRQAVATTVDAQHACQHKLGIQQAVGVSPCQVLYDAEHSLDLSCCCQLGGARLSPMPECFCCLELERMQQKERERKVINPEAVPAGHMAAQCHGFGYLNPALDATKHMT